MKTLEEHNEERYRDFDRFNAITPLLNGIACPICGKEMYDSTPMIVLTSIPAKKNIHCECGYRGYALL